MNYKGIQLIYVHESSGSSDEILTSAAGYTLYDYNANQISEGQYIYTI
jgi:hypothetical protein